MIPLLSTIVAVYCGARLLHAADELRRRNRDNNESNYGWIGLLLAALIIGALCYQIWQRADEFNRQLDQIRR